MGGPAKAVQKVVDTVVTTAENIVKNPLPVIETVALTAIGVPAPVASAAVTAANGGSVENIAKSAIGSYTGGAVGGEAGNIVAGATDSNVLANIAGSAAGSAASTLVKGGNLDQAFSNAVLGAAGQSTMEAFKGDTTPTTAPETPTPTPASTPEAPAPEPTTAVAETPVVPAPQENVIPTMPVGVLPEVTVTGTQLPSQDLAILDLITPQPQAPQAAPAPVAATLPEVKVTAEKEQEPLEVSVLPEQPPASVSEPEPPKTAEPQAETKVATEQEKYKPDLFIMGGVTPRVGQRTTLGQALGVDTGGISPLATTGLTSFRGAGEIESSETGGKRQNVWNEASLRLKDALGL